MRMHPVSTLVLAAGLLTLGGPASAGSLISDAKNTCTTALCGAQTISGTVGAVVKPGTTLDLVTAPFVIEVYAQPNDCLRLEVTVMEDDLAMTLVAPSIFGVWQDDDSGGLNKPRIEVNGLPSAGWYTLTVSIWDGFPIDADFTLKYGRYNLDNPNCSSPTPLAATDSGLSTFGAESLKTPRSEQ